MPRVSVIVPAYNQCQYLGEAIRSVLAQDYGDFEVIVVDDGSTDDTRVVATGTGDARVRYVFQDNRGLSAARNTGIREARGSLLSFLDSDDAFLPRKLSLLVGALDERPELGLVAGQAVLIDDRGQPVDEIFDRGIPEDSSELLMGNPLHVGSVLLRREWQERVGPFDESLRSYEDWDMWLRLVKAQCPTGWVPQPVSLYRFHGEQMTRRGDQMTTAAFAVLDKVYRDPDVPAAWSTRRDQAYGRAFLRAAAQAYSAGELDRARECMREAVALSPELCADDGEPVARLVAGWANHAKTAEPLAFLDRIYRNLPDELSVLRRRGRRDLAREARQLAFEASRRGDAATARRRVGQAVRYRPTVLFDRGVLSLLVRPRLTRRRDQPLSEGKSG